MPWYTQTQRDLGTGGSATNPGNGVGGYASDYPGSALGPLSATAFRGQDPASMLRGPLDSGPAGRGGGGAAPGGGAGGGETTAGFNPGAYPGQGAPGSNEPRPGADPRMAPGIESRTGGNYFTTGDSSEKAPGGITQPSLTGPLPTAQMQQAAPPPAQPAAPPMKAAAATATPQAPAPAAQPPAQQAAQQTTQQTAAAAPLPNVQQKSVAKTASAPVTETKNAVVTDPGTSPDRYDEYVKNKPWKTDERNFKEQFGRTRPDAFSSWTNKQQNEWMAKHYQDPNPPGSDAGQGGVGPTGDLYTATYGDKPIGGKDLWGDAKQEDGPDYTYDPQTGLGAFTVDGKPLTVTSGAFSAADLDKIGKGPGSSYVLRAATSAQNAFQQIMAEQALPANQRRPGVLTKALGDLSMFRSVLKRYGINFDPALPGSEGTQGDGAKDPFKTPDTSDQGVGDVLSKDVINAFKDANKLGLSPDAAGAAIELQQQQNQYNDRLAARGQAFDIGLESKDLVTNDPARGRYTAIANEIADNPDPLGEAGYATLRGNIVDKGDQDIAASNDALARQAAMRGLDPLTFAGTSATNTMEGKRRIRNDLADQEVKRALRSRVGQQDALNALTGVSRYTGADVAANADLQRILLDQGIVGSPYSGMTDYSTGYRAFEQSKQNAADQADAAAEASRNALIGDVIKGGASVAAAAI